MQKHKNPHQKSIVAQAVEIKDFNPARPCNVDWFQRELDRACTDRGISFRIVWGVEPNKFKGVVGGVELIEKKYKHPLMQAREYTRGYRIFRGNSQVGYEYHPSGIITGSPDGIRIPDHVLEHRGLDRWVIEQRLRDDVARKQHFERRYIFIDGHKFDALGEFPAEGVWTWFHQIEKHDSCNHQDTGFCQVCACCRHFETLGKMCVGSYKEPDHRDLEFIRASIYESLKTPLLRNPADPPTAHEIQREAQKQRDLATRLQQKREDEEDREASEIVQSLLRISAAPTFDMGSVKQNRQTS